MMEEQGMKMKLEIEKERTMGENEIENAGGIRNENERITLIPEGITKNVISKLASICTGSAILILDYNYTMDSIKVLLIKLFLI